MQIALFGATGTVGQGVLRECLRDPTITSVISVGRRPTGVTHPKLTEIVHRDLFDLSPIASRFTSVDACFCSLGVSSVGMNEADYSRITADLPIAVARTLKTANPQMTFIFVTGVGTDSTEKGPVMWARVKGRAENAILGAGFRRAFVFRPGLILAGRGIRSSTGWYNFFYAVMRPFYPLLGMWKSQVLTTEQLGRAAIAVARDGYARPVLHVPDINSL
jgi:uncharacterized protein YbjT (DUF2867 family)